MVIAIEIGHELIMKDLPIALDEFNQSRLPLTEPMPWLAALVCASAFDLAIHDAYGVVNEVPTYQSYGKEFLSSDLSRFLESSIDSNISFESNFPLISWS